MSTAQRPDRVPDAKLPKKRWPALSRVLFSLFGLAFLVGLAGAVVAFYGYQEFTLPGPLEEKKVYEIKKGLGTPDIASALQEEGIISDAKVFSAISYLKGARGALKAGEYEFPAGATMRDVMALIESGKSIVYKVSIPEGWTSDAVVARISDNPVLTGDVTAAPVEGAVLPDTYVFKRGLTRQKMIDDMEAAQTKLVDELWAKRDPNLLLKTKEEAVTLASIVEKETGKADERPVIASVFLNRLAKNMRLQSDPTIIYGITGGKGKLDRPLTKTDITTPTPYNTYTINGLPPGPIANPGRAALEAVMNPPATTFLYFVADGSGGHAFASTLEEHNKNVAAWRKVNAEQDSASAMTGMDGLSADDTAGQPAQPGNTLPDIAAPQQKPGDGTSDDGVLKKKQPETGVAAIPAPDATATDGLDQAAANATQAQPPAPAKPPSVAMPGDASTGQASSMATAPAEPAVQEPAADLTPGSVIKSGKKLIPIPKNKPKQ